MHWIGPGNLKMYLTSHCCQLLYVIKASSVVYHDHWTWGVSVRPCPASLCHWTTHDETEVDIAVKEFKEARWISSRLTLVLSSGSSQIWLSLQHRSQMRRCGENQNQSNLGVFITETNLGLYAICDIWGFHVIADLISPTKEEEKREEISQSGTPREVLSTCWGLEFC